MPLQVIYPEIMRQPWPHSRKMVLWSPLTESNPDKFPLFSRIVSFVQGQDFRCGNVVQYSVRIQTSLLFVVSCAGGTAA